MLAGCGTGVLRVSDYLWLRRDEAAKINMANIEKTNERTTETMARSRGRRARWRTPGSNAVAQAVSARRERDRPVRQAANAASAGVTEKFTMLRQIARNDGGREEGGGSGRRSEPEEMVETPGPGCSPVRPRLRPSICRSHPLVIAKVA